MLHVAIVTSQYKGCTRYITIQTITKVNSITSYVAPLFSIPISLWNILELICNGSCTYNCADFFLALMRLLVICHNNCYRCGIGLDTWMLPIHRDILNGYGIQQPLLFINSFDFQWKENVQQMMKLTRAPDEQGISQSSLLTLK